MCVLLRGWGGGGGGCSHVMMSESRLTDTLIDNSPLYNLPSGFNITLLH